MIRHKFGNIPVMVDGITFSSKKESRYYQDLLLAKKSGDLLFFLRQVPFHLPGGVRYVVDFETIWKDGHIEFVDVKGFFTPASKMKIKMVEELYFPVKIIIV